MQMQRFPSSANCLWYLELGVPLHAIVWKFAQGHLIPPKLILSIHLQVKRHDFLRVGPICGRMRPRGNIKRPGRCVSSLSFPQHFVVGDMPAMIIS